MLRFNNRVFVKVYPVNVEGNPNFRDPRVLSISEKMASKIVSLCKQHKEDNNEITNDVVKEVVN